MNRYPPQHHQYGGQQGPSFQQQPQQLAQHYHLQQQHYNPNNGYQPQPPYNNYQQQQQCNYQQQYPNNSQYDDDNYQSTLNYRQQPQNTSMMNQSMQHPRQPQQQQQSYQQPQSQQQPQKPSAQQSREVILLQKFEAIPPFNPQYDPYRLSRLLVAVRARPLGRKELDSKHRDIIKTPEWGNEDFNAPIRLGQSIEIHEPKFRVDRTPYTDIHEYKTDQIFGVTSSNEQIYQRIVQPLVHFSLHGGRSTCFAYGQTGSGKTFTLLGHQPTGVVGLYTYAVIEIFQNLPPNISVEVCFFEIYGGKLFDLLNKKKELVAREDEQKNVNIVGLSENPVKSISDVFNFIEKGMSIRSQAATGANSDSSRSHAVLQFLFRKTDEQKKNTIDTNKSLKHTPQFAIPLPYGKLSFIDLAGSERGSDTSQNNAQVRKEGADINKSLLALKECIRAIDMQSTHTPYRGSVLTQVLKDSLSGAETRTAMIANVSPSSQSCEHTVNTLRYAVRIKESTIGSGKPSKSSASSAIQQAMMNSALARLSLSPNYIQNNTMGSPQVQKLPSQMQQQRLPPQQLQQHLQQRNTQQFYDNNTEVQHVYDDNFSDCNTQSSSPFSPQVQPLNHPNQPLPIPMFDSHNHNNNNTHHNNNPQFRNNSNPRQSIIPQQQYNNTTFTPSLSQPNSPPPDFYPTESPHQQYPQPVQFNPNLTLPPNTQSNGYQQPLTTMRDGNSSSTSSQQQSTLPLPHIPMRSPNHKIKPKPLATCMTKMDTLTEFDFKSEIYEEHDLYNNTASFGSNANNNNNENSISALPLAKYPPSMSGMTQSINNNSLLQNDNDHYNHDNDHDNELFSLDDEPTPQQQPPKLHSMSNYQQSLPQQHNSHSSMPYISQEDEQQQSQHNCQQCAMFDKCLCQPLLANHIKPFLQQSLNITKEVMRITKAFEKKELDTHECLTQLKQLLTHDLSTQLQNLSCTMDDVLHLGEL